MARKSLESYDPSINTVFLALALLMLANLVMQDAVERIFVGDVYGDKEVGIYIIRGENVVLLGEIVHLISKKYWLKDLDKEDEELPQRRVSGKEAQEAFNKEIESRKRKERSQNRVLRGMVSIPSCIRTNKKGFSVNDWTLEEMNLY